MFDQNYISFIRNGLRHCCRPTPTHFSDLHCTVYRH